jgi:hypothetical protein
MSVMVLAFQLANCGGDAVAACPARRVRAVDLGDHVKKLRFCLHVEKTC